MTEELREDGWTPDEHHCYQACRAIARDGAPLSVEHARELIEATRAVFERNHSSSTQRLNKSSHITRALRLMSSEQLYPPMVRTVFKKVPETRIPPSACSSRFDGGMRVCGVSQENCPNHCPPQPGEHTMLLARRLELMFDILEDSPQRPVLEAAALVSLEQELEERWSRSGIALGQQPGALASARAVEVSRKSDEAVLPLLALLSELEGEEAAAELERQYEVLRGARLQDRRLIELVSTFRTYGDSPGLASIAERTYEAIFAGAGPEAKKKLVDRLLKEIERHRLGGRADVWELLLEPLLSQNLSSLYVQQEVLKMALQREPQTMRPHVLRYLEVVGARHPEALDAEALRFAAEYGTREFIRALWPVTEHTSQFLGRPTQVARRAQEAVDAIVAREELDDTAGSLSVAAGEGGELSVVRASHGALSLDESEVRAPARPAEGPDRRRLVAVAIAAVVALAGVMGLIVLALL